MKFKYLFVIIFLSSCTVNSVSQKYSNQNYNSKGFVLVYNEQDYLSKNISKKFDNSKLTIGHNTLRTGTMVKITNPDNKKTLNIKILKRVKYPDFYKLLITKTVAEKLDLDINFPYLDILVLKKNKSFVAKKAVTFSEEQKIHNNAPVEKVEISNISKSNTVKKKIKREYSILIASFYSKKTATLLKKRLIIFLENINKGKIVINSNKKNNYDLLLGPYNSINSLKNDYIKVKSLGFEELDIKLHD